MRIHPLSLAESISCLAPSDRLPILDFLLYLPEYLLGTPAEEFSHHHVSDLEFRKNGTIFATISHSGLLPGIGIFMQSILSPSTPTISPHHIRLSVIFHRTRFGCS